MYPPKTDSDRLRHLLIELEWANRRHPHFIGMIRNSSVSPAEAASNALSYALTAQDAPTGDNPNA